MGAMKPYPVTPHRAHWALLPRRSGRPTASQIKSRKPGIKHQMQLSTATHHAGQPAPRP